MHDHRETLALAAAAIDFELDPAERAQLDAALETCTLCRRQASAMRATATIMHRPSDIGTPGRVRDVVIGAALRGGKRSPRFGSLLVASLSLLVVLGGTAVIVGNRGFGIRGPEQSSSPEPSGPSVAAATPTPSSAAAPEPTSTPVVTAPVDTPSPGADGHLRAGDVAAMVTDGRLVIRTLPQATADSAIFKTRLYPGQRVLILEGPVEGSGYPWFRIRLGAIEGWVAAAGRDGEPWLAPVRNGVIAFVREAQDGSGEAIYTVRPDETASWTLMLADPSLVHYEDLTWSPDGLRLAFVGTPADPVGASSQIYVVNADGSNLVRITNGEAERARPAWSPGGTQIAFEQGGITLAGSDTVLPGSAVVVVGADGTGFRIVGEGSNPVWSPDGLVLALTVPDGDASRIYVQPSDTRQLRRVSEAFVAAAPVAWSPDGQRLVFASSGLSLVEVATGSITPLTSRAGSAPAWSIRGMIAFWTADSPSPSVLVIGSDGVGQRPVAEGVSFAAVPVWAPDGRRILLGTDAAVSPIAVVDPSGGEMTSLVEGNDTIRSPAWQPLVP